MLTIFAVPKPFQGDIKLTQRNAIRSWLQLRPNCEIILFGDEVGVADTAAEFGVQHMPSIGRNEYGTPTLNTIFERALQVGKYRLKCFINADIILMSDFIPTVNHVSSHHDRFLMIGRRWNIDVKEALDFQAGWEDQLRKRVIDTASLEHLAGVDYFVFPGNFWGEIPPFAIGRPYYDNWLVNVARERGVPVIDASQLVMAIHQTHGYSHIPGGRPGAYSGPEGRRNLELAGGHEKIFSFDSVTEVLTTSGLESALYRQIAERESKLVQGWKEFAERTEWALRLDREVKERDERILKLQKEFDERTEWAQRLNAEATRKEGTIMELSKEIRELESEKAQLLDRLKRAKT